MSPLNILAGQLTLIDAEPLLQRLLFASVEAAALALVVAVLIRLARFRSPRLTCLLWLVVLLKPLVSLGVGSPLPILRLDRPVSLAELPVWSPTPDLGGENAEPAFAKVPMAVAAEGRVSEDTGAFAARPQAPVSIEEAPEPLLTAETVPAAIAAVWLVGLLVFLAIHRVRVRIGELSGVEPDLFASAFDLVKEQTLCAHATLDITRVPARWECQACATTFAPGAPLQCARCGAPARLAAGDEILLEHIEMEVP